MWVDIAGFGIVTNFNMPPYCVFIVFVREYSKSWTIYRRLSQFRYLFSYLQDKVLEIPLLPSIEESFQPLALERSGFLLGQWLKSVIAQPTVTDYYIVKNFLFSDANVAPSNIEIQWTGVNRENSDDLKMDELFDNEKPTLKPNRRSKQELLTICSDSDPDSDKDSESDSDSGSSNFSNFLANGELLSNFQDYHFCEHLNNASDQCNCFDENTEHELDENIDELDDQINNEYKLNENKHKNINCTHQKTKVPPSLEDFEMLKVLGKGNFGKVFLVREKRSRQLFAMKVLKKEHVIRKNQIEHTKTERNVLSYVRHPFIVNLKIAFQTKDKLFFILDYCPGGELFFHLAKVGHFTESRAKFYAAEITSALEHMHKFDIIYRDLKPENVLLDKKGHIRLTDFGLSKEGVSQIATGAYSLCGTPEYLAPEILNEKGHGRAVDWWSLGALLYEMLTGLPPFYSQDRRKLFEKIQNGELTFPRGLSDSAKNLLRGLLTRDPTKRLGSGKDDALEIKRHLFFAEIDWVRLERGEIQSPWQPAVVGSLDTSQFDNEFTSMPIASPETKTQPNDLTAHSMDRLFEGFTFTDEFPLEGMATTNN